MDYPPIKPTRKVARRVDQGTTKNKVGRSKLSIKIDEDLQQKYEVQIFYVHNSNTRSKPFALCLKEKQKLVNTCFNK